MCDNILYEALGVERNSSVYEIRSAYLRVSEKYKEDADKLELIRASYKVLMNPDLRLIYDESGIEGLNKIYADEHQNQNDDTIIEDPDDEDEDDIFHIREDPVKTFTVEVTLEQLYFGCKIPMNVPLDSHCSHCKGTGNEFGQPHPKCPKCGGSGHILINLYPRAMTMAKQICENCLGRGEIENEFSICSCCYGRKTEKKYHKFILYINPGTRGGDIINVPNLKNVKIIVVQKEHHIFELLGNDLIIHKKISFANAFLDSTFPIKTINGKILLIKSENCVITPNSSFVIESEGFPLRENPHKKGNLIVVFTVEMPDTFELRPNIVKEICKIQPRKDITVEPPTSIRDKLYFIDLPFSDVKI
ncbi:hypothetical protein TRFO_16086 [Tritrichomonas foetus]|uniref:DnaJ domain containing protein n=1 Tax=Tritrichomonas foetus TaxID=1144522 RepID=A0A1J4KQX3_9EUKA|nr:hypothetical protein TRFO_16086 [Tritrichomonas foetus]|eukprot:OHT13663.1 hypothetical protein TRFO_16086 [Tritrichomonas foetus]